MDGQPGNGKCILLSQIEITCFQQFSVVTRVLEYEFLIESFLFTWWYLCKWSICVNCKWSICVLQWIQTYSFESNVCVLHGRPGNGKSTLLLKFDLCDVLTEFKVCQFRSIPFFFLSGVSTVSHWTPTSRIRGNSI